MKIGNRIITEKQNPFIVAELSGNHDGSLRKALKIVDKVAESGADAIKLQTYSPESMTINSQKKSFFIKDKSSLWYGKSLFELYKIAMTPWNWHKPIFERAKKNKLIFFSSPFDEKAVNFLESLNVPAYKIASFENTDHNLIEIVSKKKKPIIISTGLASKKELKEAVKILENNKAKNYALLKCTSAYPADPSESNLKTIMELKKTFKCEVGLSDHTKGITTAISSITFGASIIEKHVKLSKYDSGVDSAFSLDPEELKELVLQSKISHKSIGNVSFGPTQSEKKNLKFRRSLYVIKNVKKNEILSKDNIKTFRPLIGIEAKYFKKVIGKKFKKELKKNTPLRKGMFK